MGIKKYLIGDTIQLTWVNSGITPSDIVASVRDGNEVLVDSGAMVSSGNGHYYFDHTVVNTLGFYVGETKATINALPYKNRLKFKAVDGSVD